MANTQQTQDQTPEANQDQTPEETPVETTTTLFELVDVLAELPIG